MLDKVHGSHLGAPTEKSGSCMEINDAGFSSRMRRTLDDRPENTLVKIGEEACVPRSSPRRPSRCRVNVPGALTELFPARSMKSMPCSIQ
jgi:hypothetical protein